MAGFCVLFGVLLSACGGGGSSPPPPVAITAQDDQFTVAWAKTATLDVVSNDGLAGQSVSLVVGAAPAHGQVTVHGSTLQYTPAAGYYGDDQFSYKASTAASSATATVKLSVEAEIELNGSISPIPVTTTEVTAQVGERQFKGTADAQGRYKLSVKSTQAEAPVRLTAKGSGAQAHFAYASLIALPATSPLTEQQLPALRLDVLTTARQGLLLQRGALPTTSTGLREAFGRQSLHDVIDVATLLRHVLQDGAALPAGMATTTDLAANASALAVLQEQWRLANAGIGDPAEVEKTLNELAPSSPPFVGAQGSRLAVRSEASEGDGWLSGMFDLRSDGGASVFVGENVNALIDGATWTRDGNTLTVTLPSPVLLTWDTYVSVIQFRQIRGSDDQASRQLMTRQWQNHCQGSPNDPSSVCPDHYGYTAWKPVVSFDIARDRRALLAEDFAAGTSWAGVVVTPNSVCICVQELATFDGSLNAGGLTGKLVDGQWQLDGNLYGRPFGFRYTRLGSGEDGIEYWLIEMIDRGVMVKAVLMPVAKLAPFALDATSAARRWATYQLVNSANPANGRAGLQMNFHRDGRLTNTPFEFDSGGRWSLSADGRVITITYSTFSESTQLVRGVSGGFLELSQGGLHRRRDLGPAD